MHPLQHLKAGLTACFVALLLLSPVTASAQEMADSGLITNPSGSSVQSTVDQLVSAIEEQGLTVMTVVDHGANAAGADLKLRPTQLIIFGNPNLGTQLMNNSRSVAIDLPQKYLVWEDAEGGVHVTYNSVDYLVSRHGLTGPEEALSTIEGALANFAASVAPEEPKATPTAAPGTVPPPGTIPETGGSSGNASIWLALAALAAGVLLLLNRNVRRGWRVWVVGAVVVLAAAFAAQGAVAQMDNGLISNSSPYSVDETVARLQSEIEGNGLTVMTVVNHSANAESVDMSLPPTQLIIFGNPAVGTQLMQSSQSIGIDLPQKYLVWEGEDGSVTVTHNDPAYLAARHGITDKDEVVGNVTNALQGIVDAATAE